MIPAEGRHKIAQGFSRSSVGAESWGAAYRRQGFPFACGYFLSGGKTVGASSVVFSPLISQVVDL